MQIRFINRHSELRFLNERYQGNNFEFIILHGRRRVGKSYLLQKFIKGKKSVYLQADQSSQKDQLEYLYAETTRQLSNISQIFRSLDDYFEYLTNFQDDRLIIVFDEFQYLVQSIEGITSIIQRWVDTRWKNTKLFIILCGSEIRMMEELFAYHNPLHGRRTGQWKIEPFFIPAIVEFFPDLPVQEIVKVQSVFGSIPAYLSYYDPTFTLLENISSTMLSEGQPLFEEPLFLLRQEFREVARYFSILKAVASGETRLVNISNKTGIDARTLPKYLSNLISTNLLMREVPVGLKKTTSKYVHYRIADPYMRFWFRFINPYVSMLKIDGKKAVVDKIAENLDNFMGTGFENFLIELIRLMNVQELLPDLYTEIGRWWKKGVEIDIVGISKSSILCIEIKYGDKIDGKRELNKLQNKIDLTLFRNQKVYTIVVARGYTVSCKNCFTLDELWKRYRDSEELKIK